MDDYRVIETPAEFDDAVARLLGGEGPIAVDAERASGFRYSQSGYTRQSTGGCGFWNAMRIYPGQRLAIVAMANTTTAWDVDRLFAQLRRLPWH